MKTDTTKQTAIIAAAAAAVAVAVVAAAAASNSAPAIGGIAVAGVFALLITLGYRYLALRKTAPLELTSGEEYRKLAEEYRRLADMAITAQEHTDLKLGDVSAQLDYLREQNESLQKILRDVE